jgi:hypothetical protein
MGTKKEKATLVVNMSKTRGSARTRFLAVGIFISTVLVSSKTLIKNMRNFWRIRGHLDMDQLQERRFVLEFSKEGVLSMLPVVVHGNFEMILSLLMN